MPMEDIREHSIRSPGGSHSFAGLSITNKQMGDKAMSVYRIHPTVGVARVGNSDNYILAPETMAGAPASGDMKVTGGLPIRPGTEAETIRSSDLRDATGALKRQAARFRVFAYPEVATETWPRGDGTEVRIGDKIGDRIVKDIIWTVHVANKKANWFVLAETENQPQGIASYANGNLPDIRNPDLAHSAGPQPAQKLATLAQPDRITKLVIDPGPRVIHGPAAQPVHFDIHTTAAFFDEASGAVANIPAYPMSFPSNALGPLDCPSGPIDTLGELRTDEFGRLLVLGGRGRAVAWKIDGESPLAQDVNNDQWFDDTSDGPVNATLIFDDGSRAAAHGAWVTTTDPSFAPQILNVVSMWDDVYDVWVREMDLAPDMFDSATKSFRSTYKPTFPDQLRPIFVSSALQHWVANLSQHGISAHASLTSIDGTTDPSVTPLAGIAAIFRDPFDEAQVFNTTLMPLHLGDANEPMLALRKTQYFCLRQWSKGTGYFRPASGVTPGPGEALDKTSLVNCIGGRLSPGIDLTFVMREPAIYERAWQTAGSGPFRLRAKRLTYDPAWSGTSPVLTVGYVPRHDDADGLEPGDLSKFMALPWHTDYNSCATHPPDPPVKNNRTVFWSWPAQRPVAVYTAADVGWQQPGDLNSNLDPSTLGFTLGRQVWSVRGWGTDASDAENWGRYADRKDMLENWHRIGTIIQANAIEPAITHDDTTGSIAIPSDWYLEAEGQLRDTGKTLVVPFPNLATEIPTAADLAPFQKPDPEPDDPVLSPDTFNPGAVRELFHQLINIADYPGATRNARRYLDFWLNWAEAWSNNPRSAPQDRLFFPYTRDALEARLDLIYQELVDDAVERDPQPGDPPPLFKTRDDMLIRIRQFTPLNLLDGAWLRNIAKAGPTDDVHSLLFSIWMDEFGDGDVARNHCNIYLDLCHSVGYYPPPLDSRDFAFDPEILDSAYTVPTFELAISQFTEDYLPEIIGMTLQLEWEVVGLKPTRDKLVEFDLDPHFYIMHIGIDNAVNGHGRRALDATVLYLQSEREAGGIEAEQRAWRRIWNGYVAFAQIGNLGQDLPDLIHRKRSPSERMLALIKSKAEYGSRNHQLHELGGIRIDELFAVPEKFLSFMVSEKLLVPGDWDNSRMNKLIQFGRGPMFRVFTDDEIALLEEYTNSLTDPSPPSDRTPPPAAAAMRSVIEQLKGQQTGVPGHTQHMLKDKAGVDHTVTWWFGQPPTSFMEALARPENGFITPGNPAGSPFLMQWITPDGPMGDAFDAPARIAPDMTCRDVVRSWIVKGCPLVGPATMLRLTSSPARRDRHPTGRIYGMGSVH